jgi:ribosomal protein L11 methyltransferase
MQRLAVHVRREASELALAELLTFAPSGVEETDVDPGTVAYAIYATAERLPTAAQLQAVLGDALVTLRTSEVADDWADRWREFHRPLVLGDRLSVRPPWEPRIGTELEIVIDPGQAFGTGAHATTRLCLEALLELRPPATAAGPAPSVIDLGCGSGVLAIAAAKLGWAPVLALDYDPLSVDATRENAAVNGVTAQIDVHRFDLNEQPPPPAPLVLANLLAPLLTTWVGQLAAGAPRPQTIVASGILATEAEYIARLYIELGFELRKQLVHAEWAALILSGPEPRSSLVPS